MSSYGEDIIRETFEKLGDAIGVQMQIPDAMIANLGAVLQAQIDLLAELQSAGRLVPPGGMALTAERVENVRAAREELRGYRNFTGYGRSHVNRLIAAVDALFPATEPAEEAPNLAAVAQEPRRFDPADECQNDNHDPGCTCGALHWMTTPAPAEPAEEETKAEHNASVARREALGRVAQQLYEQSFDGCDGTFYHDFGRALEDFLPSQGWTRIPTSSPVVPAPNETGPWQTWQEVPDGVQYYGINGWGPTYYVNRGSVRYRVFDDTPSKTADYVVQNFAPFVAAEEG